MTAPCEECGAPLSGRAQFCGECGHPVPQKPGAFASVGVAAAGARAFLASRALTIKRVLLGGALVGLGLAVAAVALPVILQILEPTPEEEAADAARAILRQAPSVDGLRALLVNSAGAATAVAEDPTRLDAWTTWTNSSWPALLAAWETADLCRRTERMGTLGLVTGPGQRVAAACRNHSEARAALTAAETANATLMAEYRELEREVEAAEAALRVARESLAAAQADLHYFSGWMHQIVEPNVYEVSEGGPFGTYYLLKARTVEYKTTGNFSLWVEVTGSTMVTTKAGLSAKRVILTEADTTLLELTRANVRDAQATLDDARAALRRAVRPSTTDTGALEARLASAAQRVARAVEGTTPLPPWSTPQTVSDAGELVEYLSAVCSDAAPGADGTVRCARCPAESEDSGGDGLRLTAAVRGSFSAADKHEVILALEGCGGGFNFDGSTALIRYDDDAGWQRVAHDADIVSSGCKPTTIGGRQALVCQHTVVGQGAATSYATLLTAKADSLESAEVAVLNDLSAACQFAGDFGASIDDVFVEDVDGSGQEKVVVLATLSHGTYRLGETPGGDGDECDDVEQGLVDVRNKPRVFLRGVNDSAATVVDAVSPAIKSARVIEHLSTARDPLPDMRRRADELLSFAPDSESAWIVYSRRIEAYRNAGELEAFARELPRLAALFPARATELALDLAEACEEAEDFACPAEQYEALLASDPTATVRGRAAWYYATAPPPFRDVERAAQLIDSASADGALDGRGALARAELFLQRQDVEGARQFLQEFRKSKKSKLVDEALAQIDSATARERPRDIMPVRIHKVPPEWEFGVPTGEILPLERVFVLELEAIQHRNAKRFEQAEALYREALRRVSNPHVANTLRLGLGSVFERAGRFDQALAHYEEMLRTESERDPRIVNRMAWFLLTVDSAAHRDDKRGMELASRAVDATGRHYPGVLDTLAEAHLRRGDKETARGLLEECIRLDPGRDYYRERLESL